MKIEMPEKLGPAFSRKPGTFQYIAAYGGRGSGKSFNFAKMAAIRGYLDPLRILATREIQASIKTSFHAELKAAIASEPFLAHHYDVGVDYIKGRNGTEFIFQGLRHGINSIKSMAKIDLTIVEEAEDVPEASWLALEATVFRQPKSEMWVIWNPRIEGSPVDKRFRKNPPENAYITKMNYTDNKWFPPLMEELRRREQKRLDAGTYAHVWEGEYLSNAKALVFNNWRVDDFEAPDGIAHYFGADWGFSNDPTVLIRCHVEGRTLYFDHEAYKIGCDIDKTPNLFDTVPRARDFVIRADSARPEVISYMRRHGYPRIVAAKKGSDSVRDGIGFLQSYDIVVHPRCKNLIAELKTYRYKLDKLTGEVLPILNDTDNHVIDAARYALENVRRKTSGMSVTTYGKV